MSLNGGVIITVFIHLTVSFGYWNTYTIITIITVIENPLILKFRVEKTTQRSTI